MRKFKIQKVKRVLNLKDTGTGTYIMYKVTGPHIKKYFRFKYEAEAWVKNYTTNHPLTDEQTIDLFMGR